MLLFAAMAGVIPRVVRHICKQIEASQGGSTTYAMTNYAAQGREKESLAKFREALTQEMAQAAGK